MRKALLGFLCITFLLSAHGLDLTMEGTFDNYNKPTGGVSFFLQGDLLHNVNLVSSLEYLYSNTYKGYCVTEFSKNWFGLGAGLMFHMTADELYPGLITSGKLLKKDVIEFNIQYAMGFDPADLSKIQFHEVSGNFIVKMKESDSSFYGLFSKEDTSTISKLLYEGQFFVLAKQSGIPFRMGFGFGGRWISDTRITDGYDLQINGKARMELVLSTKQFYLEGSSTFISLRESRIPFGLTLGVSLILQ